MRAPAAGALTAAREGELVAEAETLLERLPATPAFRAAVIRLPSCFRGFDQHPDDLRRLADRVAAASPAPFAVVGLRTSGSYLAPLLAAMLRRRGHEATALTARPSHALPGHKRRALRAGGTVVITDDPPSSGGSIATVAAAVERLGVSPASIVLALALFGDELPSALKRWPAAVLPWEEWSVHDRLHPSAVCATLAALWPDERITEVRRLPLPAMPRRGHVAARYRVELAGAGSEDVYVRGAGLGYFGDHAIEVQRRLEAWVPELHGVVDGLAFRPWLAEERRLRTVDAGAAREIAAYAAERRSVLAVASDPTGAFAGQDPVWEVAGTLLSAAFGRGWRVVRLASLDAIMRRLLRAERPSVVDGAMGRRHWFAGKSHRDVLKPISERAAAQEAGGKDGEALSPSPVRGAEPAVVGAKAKEPTNSRSRPTPAARKSAGRSS